MLMKGQLDKKWLAKQDVENLVSDVLGNLIPAGGGTVLSDLISRQRQRVKTEDPDVVEKAIEDFAAKYTEYRFGEHRGSTRADVVASALALKVLLGSSKQTDEDIRTIYREVDNYIVENWPKSQGVSRRA